MARDERFTFLIDRDERRMITALAQRLRRTESDAVRYVVLEAARALETEAQPDTMTAQAHEAQHDAQ
jgi:hypothetical protein